jgi:hypothetical protein
MIHRLEPQSEWDKRYAAYVEKQAKKAEPKVRKKPGPVKGQPMPKKKPVALPMGMSAIVMKMMGD